MPIVRFPSLRSMVQKEEISVTAEGAPVIPGPRNIMASYLKLWLRPSGTRMDIRARVPKQQTATHIDKMILSDVQKD